MRKALAISIFLVSVFVLSSSYNNFMANEAELNCIRKQSLDMSRQEAIKKHCSDLVRGR